MEMSKIFLSIAILGLLVTGISNLLANISMEKRIKKLEVHVDVAENIIINILTQLRGKP